MRNSSCSRMSYNYMENVVSSSGNDKNQKLKDRECNGPGSVLSVGRVSDDADQLIISTWSPRHYTCNFCKRRFKSAQALGGHMNVHRRARALLRSQSISPISSPWHPTNIVTAAHDHPQQNDESHFIFTNPNPNLHLQNTHHHTRNPSYPYLHSLPIMMSITSPSAPMHVNPHSATASAYNHAPHADQRINGVISARMDSCIRHDQGRLTGLLMSSKNTNQDDALVSLSLGNGSIISNSTDEQDIDLELHL